MFHMSFIHIYLSQKKGRKKVDLIKVFIIAMIATGCGTYEQKEVNKTTSFSAKMPHCVII